MGSGSEVVVGLKFTHPPPSLPLEGGGEYQLPWAAYDFIS